MTRERALDRRARDRRPAIGWARRTSVRRRRSRSTARRKPSSSSRAAARTAFTACCASGLYAAYTWRVRHFREGETNETADPVHARRPAVRLREKLKEDAPGAALDAAEARRRAEAEAPARWNVDLAPFVLVEQGQEQRPGGRIDHTLTYERSSPVLGEGRYRLRLVVSGDRLTEVTHFVQIPEAFTRRYDEHAIEQTSSSASARSSAWCSSMSSAASASASSSCCAAATCCGGRPPSGDSSSARMQALATLNEWPLMWMTYDTAVPRSDFHRRTDRDARRDADRFLRVHGAVVHGRRNADAACVRAAPAVLAGLGEGPGQFVRHPGPHGRGLPARVGVLRLRRRTVRHCDAGVRLVDAVGGAAPPRRPRHLRSLAVGDRQLSSGGILGRVPVPRGPARRRGAHRRPVWKAHAVPGRRVSSSSRPSSARVMRRTPRSLRSRGRSSSSSRRSGSVCSTSTSACFPGSSCISRSTSSGSRCPFSCRTHPASGSRRSWSSS